MNHYRSRRFQILTWSWTLLLGRLRQNKNCFCNFFANDSRSSTPWFISDAASGKHRDVVRKTCKKSVHFFTGLHRCGKWNGPLTTLMATKTFSGLLASTSLLSLCFVFKFISYLLFCITNFVWDLKQTDSCENPAPKDPMYHLQHFGRRAGHQLDYSEDYAEVKKHVWSICLVSEWRLIDHHS